MIKGKNIQDTAAEEAIKNMENKNQCVIVSKSLPVASASVCGEVHIYTGLNNGTRKPGYIYECQKDAEYSANVSFRPATISGTTVTCSPEDFGLFVKRASAGQADPLDVRSGTMTYDSMSALWRFVGKDTNRQNIVAYQVYQGDYEDWGFTFTGTPQDGDVVSFVCFVSELPGAQYYWSQINPPLTQENEG